MLTDRHLVSWMTGLVGATAVVTASPPGPDFVERAAELGLVHEIVSGLDRVGDRSHQSDWAQTGIALGDVDGDGDLDVVAAGGVGRTALFRNDGESFVDVTEGAGLGAVELFRVPTLGDYDADGDLDLWLGAFERGAGRQPGRGRLYRNDGHGRFEDVTALSGTPGGGHSLHAQWADLDLDGLLDLYVSEFSTTRNLHYRNLDGRSFAEASTQLSTDAPGSTHITAVFDADDDGHPDLFVGNDAIVTDGVPGNAGDFVLHSAPDGTFDDVSVGSGSDHRRAIMGLAVADVNHDGRLDLYKSDADANRLMINRGWPASGVPWEESQDTYGVAAARVEDPERPGTQAPAIGWAAVIADLDLDRWLDLVVANGHVASAAPGGAFSRSQPNHVYRGLGPTEDFRFADVTAESALAGAIDDRALAMGDVDDDGDLDLVIAPTSGLLRYYDNPAASSGRGWVRVRPHCRTTAPGCPGVRVTRLDADGYPHVRVLAADAPAASQHDVSTAHFGLDDEPYADVSLRFPSGIETPRRRVPAGVTLDVWEPRLIELPSRTTSASPIGGPPRTITVVAHAHDRQGLPLDGTAEVAIEIDGLEPTTGALHVDGSRFERTFAVPTEPGGYRVRVRFDDFRVRIRPWLHVLGPLDLRRSTVVVSPEAVRAGSDDRVRVTVVPRDGRGLALGPGRAVSIGLAGSRPPRPAVDHGDGRYSLQLTAPERPGAPTVAVTIDGRPVEPVSAPVVEVAGSVSSSTSVLYADEPDAIQSAAPHQLKLLVRPRDAAGRRLGPEARVEVRLEPDPDTALPAVRTDLVSGGRADGDHPLVIDNAGGTRASGRLVIVVDGEDVLERDYDL